MLRALCDFLHIQQLLLDVNCYFVSTVVLLAAKPRVLDAFQTSCVSGSSLDMKDEGLRSGAVIAVMSGIIGFDRRAGIPKNLEPMALRPAPMSWQIVAAAAAAAVAGVCGPFFSDSIK